MRQILHSLLLLTLPTLVFAQRPNLRVDVGNAPPPLAVEREARPLNGVFGGTGATQLTYATPASTTVTTGSEQGNPLLNLTVPPGRLWEVLAVEVAADSACQLELRFNRNGANEVGASEAHPTVMGELRGGKQVILFPTGKFLSEGTTINLIYRIKNNLTGRSRPLYVSGSLVGKDWTAARRPQARSVVAFLTDSYGHTNSEAAVTGDNYWTYGVVNRYLDSLGIDARPVVKSFGGSTLITAAKDVRNGELSFPSDLGFFSEGFNDAKVTTAAWASARPLFKTTYAAMINNYFLSNPKSVVILSKPYPPHSSDATRLANIVDVRLAVQEVYNAALLKYPGKVFLCDFSNAYPGTDDSFYNPNETVGVGNGKEHPSLKGQSVLMAIAFQAIVATGNAYYLKAPRN